MCNRLLKDFRMCFLLAILGEKFICKSIHFWKLTLKRVLKKTMEGKKFEIDVFDIPTMAGWCPCEKIICIEVDGRKMLKHCSGVTVNLKLGKSI